MLSKCDRTLDSLLGRGLEISLGSPCHYVRTYMMVEIGESVLELKLIFYPYFYLIMMELFGIYLVLPQIVFEGESKC